MGMTLRSAREARGWTVADLVKASGVGRATIYRLESGDTPNPANSTVVDLETALGVQRGTLQFGPTAPSCADDSDSGIEVQREFASEGSAK